MLLLDEPLGALDLKLRQDMQYELIRMKKELGITFIYVTHDQEEALTMSDTYHCNEPGLYSAAWVPRKRSITSQRMHSLQTLLVTATSSVRPMIQDELVEILGSRFCLCR